MKRFEVTVVATAYAVMEIEAEDSVTAMEMACNNFDGCIVDFDDICADECVLIEDDEEDDECDGQLSMWD